MKLSFDQVLHFIQTKFKIFNYSTIENVHPPKKWSNSQKTNGKEHLAYEHKFGAELCALNQNATDEETNDRRIFYIPTEKMWDAAGVLVPFACIRFRSDTHFLLNVWCFAIRLVAIECSLFCNSPSNVEFMNKKRNGWLACMNRFGWTGSFVENCKYAPHLHCVQFMIGDKNA